MAAKIATTPETSDYTSIKQRVEQVEAQGRTAELEFERLGSSAQSWQARLEKLKGDRLLGRFFATTRAKLREISERLGVRYVFNLAGCPAR